MLSVVVPVRNEERNIESLFEAFASDTRSAGELLLVYDDEDDSTLAAADRHRQLLPCTLRFVKNTMGPGPANAIRTGFQAARGDAVAVVMADLSDDLKRLDSMCSLLEDGYDLVAASRYSRGGRQTGGPLFKKLLSSTAGRSLRLLTGLPTSDPTNAFKVYRASMLRALDYSGAIGFDISLEITVKAFRNGYRITEVPATWTDRAAGSSKFRLWKWLPRYLSWYLLALKNPLYRNGDGSKQ